MSDLGNYKLPDAAFITAIRERHLSEPLVQECAFCGARFEGEARTVQAQAREHRQHNHPKAVDRGQPARRQAAKDAPVSYWTGRTSLGEL